MRYAAPSPERPDKMPPKDVFATAAEEKQRAQQLIAVHALLMRLMHHHTSQAGGAPPCSRDYHRDLAKEIGALVPPWAIR